MASDEIKSAITNHAYGVYIIKTKFCISSTQSVVYHQVAGRYTLARDDIQPRGLMISTTLRAVMIYQVCDLDNKKPHPTWMRFFVWWGVQGSNLWPPACKADALPTELTPHNGDSYENRTRVTAVKGRCLDRLTKEPNLVAAVGFEPTTCRVWTGRYNHLSYAATSLSQTEW